MERLRIEFGREGLDPLGLDLQPAGAERLSRFKVLEISYRHRMARSKIRQVIVAYAYDVTSGFASRASAVADVALDDLSHCARAPPQPRPRSARLRPVPVRHRYRR